MSLANNHTPNYGQAGLQDTFDALDQAGIDYVGAGIDAARAHQPIIKTVNHIKIGWLAYNDSDVVPASYAAAETHAGTALMDITQMQNDALALKNQVDLIIISMHSGTEYQFTPNSRQTAFARAAIDAGADLIIGHHPHVVQSTEYYQDKLIIYSLGNFVFDQMWSQETRQGLIAEIVLNKRGVQSVEYHPVIIDDYSQPRLVDKFDTPSQNL